METEEKSFMSESDVSVSNSRFIAQGQTYAMSGITSVKSHMEPPKRVFVYILGGLGAVMFISGVFLVGLLMIGAAVGIWFLLKTDYSVLLTTASGESKALSSKDGEFIGRVVNALNDAIVHRG